MSSIKSRRTAPTHSPRLVLGLIARWMTWRVREHPFLPTKSGVTVAPTLATMTTTREHRRVRRRAMIVPLSTRVQRSALSRARRRRRTHVRQHASDGAPLSLARAPPPPTAAAAAGVFNTFLIGLAALDDVAQALPRRLRRRRRREAPVGQGAHVHDGVCAREDTNPTGALSLGPGGLARPPRPPGGNERTHIQPQSGRGGGGAGFTAACVPRRVAAPARAAPRRRGMRADVERRGMRADGSAPLALRARLTLSRETHCVRPRETDEGQRSIPSDRRMPSSALRQLASRPPVRRSSWVLRHHPTLPRRAASLLPRYASPLSTTCSPGARGAVRAPRARRHHLQHDQVPDPLRVRLSRGGVGCVRAAIVVSRVSRVARRGAFRARWSCRASRAPLRIARVVVVCASRRMMRRARLSCLASRGRVVARWSCCSLSLPIASVYGVAQRALSCARARSSVPVGPTVHSVASLAVSRAAPLVTRRRTDQSARTSS